MAGKDVSIAYADGTGSYLVLLAMAEQQGLFGKYGVDVRSVAVKGATVPRLTADMPLGMIGEPADNAGHRLRQFREPLPLPARQPGPADQQVEHKTDPGLEKDQQQPAFRRRRRSAERDHDKHD